jgi:hypothetical protein
METGVDIDCVMLSITAGQVLTSNNETDTKARQLRMTMFVMQMPLSDRTASLGSLASVES